jgi:hypothetical protein
MNEVFYDEKDGFIHNLYHGYQTAEIMKKRVEETVAIIAQLRAENKPVRVLIDLTKSQGASPQARKIGVEGVQKNDFDKAAFFGASQFTKNLMTFLLVIMGKEDKIRYFDNEEDARKFLLS